MNPQQLISNMSTAVLLVDDDLTVRFANPAAAQLFNLGISKLSGAQFTGNLLAFETDTSRLSESIQQGKQLTVSNTLLATLDGVERTVDLTLSPSGGGLGIIELRVIDQQKQIERQLNQDAQQQAACFMARNLAHEIKNPLGGLRGAAQLLAKQAQGAEYQEFTRMIIEQADRLKSLVDKLLGPQKTAPRESRNIHQVAEKVLKLVEVTLPQSVTLKRDYDPSLPEVTMDAAQIQQALLNLLQNAVQAIAGGHGCITLRTRTRRQFTTGGKRFRTAIELSVTDDGPGVPAELKETLFYPMVTGRAGGTGLGLSIAHNIARSHQGRIDCESAPGNTVFSLTLPITE